MILGRGQRRLRTTSETVVVEEQGELGMNLVIQTFKRPGGWERVFDIFGTLQELTF
jgi:hypothetical protein